MISLLASFKAQLYDIITLSHARTHTDTHWCTHTENLYDIYRHKSEEIRVKEMIEIDDTHTANFAKKKICKLKLEP